MWSTSNVLEDSSLIRGVRHNDCNLSGIETSRCWVLIFQYMNNFISPYAAFVLEL
jgi:hypothetical protein